MRDFASYDSRRDTQQPVAGHDDSGNGHPSIEAHIDSRRTTFSHASFGRSKEGTYGRSLHASRSGEWDYDISFKPLTGHLRKLGWLHAIDTAQSLVHNDAVDCGIPLLMLCSDHSSLRGKFSPRAQVTDTVLDVEQMKRWAPHLSEYVSVCTIRGAVHDVYLSQKPARLQALETSVRWMNRILSEHTI